MTDSSIDDFSVTPHTGGAPVVSVGDVSVAEGNSGTLNATFIVSVSSATHTGITFNIATGRRHRFISRDCR